MFLKISMRLFANIPAGGMSPGCPNHFPRYIALAFCTMLMVVIVMVNVLILSADVSNSRVAH